MNWADARDRNDLTHWDAIRSLGAVGGNGVADEFKLRFTNVGLNRRSVKRARVEGWLGGGNGGVRNLQKRED